MSTLCGMVESGTSNRIDNFCALSCQGILLPQAHRLIVDSGNPKAFNFALLSLINCRKSSCFLPFIIVFMGII